MFVCVCVDPGAHPFIVLLVTDLLAVKCCFIQTVVLSWGCNDQSKALFTTLTFYFLKQHLIVRAVVYCRTLSLICVRTNGNDGSC